MMFSSALDFLKSIRGELHEDLLKQQSFTDFLKDLPTFVTELKFGTKQYDNLVR